jgi:ABC-2 type transport system ATP-binding protein
MIQKALEVRNLVKRYDGVTAVDDLSFEVQQGEVFGLLGPNGAGKTTTIRIIMDIFKADEGRVLILGQPPGAARKHIGYLPEERGLYHDLKVVDVLVYLAELKSTPHFIGRQRALGWLARMEMAGWADRKVRELSRGMQQKVQFVASVLHEPEIVVLDEPFSGLDPVNVELLNEMIRDLQRAGKTVVLSAHQMNLVEALCDRIVLVNHGRAVLYGSLAEIKRRYASNSIRLRTAATLGALPGVGQIEERAGAFVLTLAGATPQDVLKTLVERNIPLEAFEVASVPLQEIFVAAVKEESRA